MIQSKDRGPWAQIEETLERVGGIRLNPKILALCKNVDKNQEKMLKKVNKICPKIQNQDQTRHGRGNIRVYGFA